MTDRVIVTDVAELTAVLDSIDRVAAARGWRTRRPSDTARVEADARLAHGSLRMANPVVVVLEIDPDAADPLRPVDATALLAATPVRGAVADGRRDRHGA